MFAAILPESPLLTSACCIAPLLLGIALLVCLRLVAGRPDPLQYDPLHHLIGVTGRVLVALGGIGFFLIVLTVAGFIGWAIAVFVLVEAARCRRDDHQHALLWTLAVSVQRSIPLAPAVDAFAQDRGGRYGVRARRLAQDLVSGVPLPQALQKIRRLLSPATLLLVSVGQQCGALPAALHRALNRQASLRVLWYSLAGRLSYAGALLLYAVAVLTFALWKTVPAYEKIFADFGTPLPAATQAFVSISHWAGAWCAPVLLPVCAILLYVPLRYLGWIPWDLPGVGRLMRPVHTALILDALGLSTSRRQPMVDVLGTLATQYPRASIRQRLTYVLWEIRGGANWCESLAKWGLISRSELAVLQSAERVGNLPWALRELADGCTRRLAYRLQAWIQVLFPLVLILFGTAVVLFALALFMPLLALIEKCL